jgi:copper chaperone CopZ/thiol-disulfide isomerase/thioredoxin
MTAKTKKTTTTKLIPITEMDCPTCVTILEKEVKKLPGVAEARANYITKTVRVTYDSDLARIIDIEAAIERVGYHVAYKTYPSAASRIKNLFKKQKTSQVGTLTDLEFPSKVIHNSKPVAVLFHSPTCRPCQMAKEVFLQAAEEAGKRADFLEMDVSSTETWHTYEITATPTTLIFIDGQPKTRLITIPQKKEIIDALLARPDQNIKKIDS